MNLLRQRIRELILYFFDRTPRLSDKQLVHCVRVLAKSASPAAILAHARELTKAGKLRRSECVRREANGRLVNLYEKPGGPTRAIAERSF